MHMELAVFQDRAAAGRVLADRLAGYADSSEVVVLALPRGGVPVGFQVARSLGAPLEVLSVRKLGVPGREELAMGAIASDGTQVINQTVVGELGISEDTLQAVAAAEQQELERRERTYRGQRPRPELTGKVVIVVDDGLAPGRPCGRQWPRSAASSRPGSWWRCRSRPPRPAGSCSGLLTRLSAPARRRCLWPLGRPTAISGRRPMRRSVPCWMRPGQPTRTTPPVADLVKLSGSASGQRCKQDGGWALEL